jgi:Ca2+:H+ antiporter
MLAVTIALMAATAEFLVDSIEFVRDKGGIQEEWFGLILLPVVSFAADGFVAIAFFFRYVIEHFLGKPTPPATLAKARAIDLSIQFILFWMPFIILLGWWLDKPISLLFDIFEVAVLIGAMLLVNAITGDSKTNWLEGFAMVSFYLMIAVTTWFYNGQTEIEEMLNFGHCFSNETFAG